MRTSTRGLRWSGAQGFTLIETMVALAVLTLALGVIYQTFGWSLRRTAVLQKREAALTVAQSVLAELSASQQLASKTQEGDEAGMHWWYVTQRVESGRNDDAVVPMSVVVDVAWGGGSTQHLRLQTVLLAKSLP